MLKIPIVARKKLSLSCFLQLKSSTAEPARPGSSQDEAPIGSGVPGLSRSIVSQQEEVLSDEELPVVTTRKLSIVVVKNGGLR